MKIGKIYFNEKDKLKKIAIALFVVFPNQNKIKIENLLDQLELSGSYLSYFQDNIQTLILSNEINLIKECQFIRKYKRSNITYFKIKNDDLDLCKKERNQTFQYAFPKIDCLKIINDYFEINKTYSHLIISDIDSIFLDINYLIKYTNKINTISAIDYIYEPYEKKGFQKMMYKMINTSLPKKFFLKDKNLKNKRMIWINSGFIIINRSLLEHLPQLSKDCYEWAKNNSDYIKESMDWGDEVIFSAIFNFVEGKAISARNSKIARFIWTCNIGGYLPYEFINPFKIPSHIHLPAIKWIPNQLKIITKLGAYSNIRFLSIIFINIWSLLERLTPDKRNLIHYKIIFKIINLIEKFLILIL